MTRNVGRISGLLLAMLLVTTGAYAFMKIDLVTGEFIARGHNAEIRLTAPHGATEFNLENGDTCGFTGLSSMTGRTLLIPTVYNARTGSQSYRVRGAVTLNFEQIKASLTDSVRTRLRGTMVCTKPDSAGNSTCTGSYAAAGTSGDGRLRGTVNHEFTGIFIDDIIIGVVPSTKAPHEFTYVGSCHAR